MIDVKATPEDPRGYYFLLGLEKNATSVEVRKAYKKAAVVKRDTHSFEKRLVWLIHTPQKKKLHHPDKNIEDKEGATVRFKVEKSTTINSQKKGS